MKNSTLAIIFVLMLPVNSLFAASPYFSLNTDISTVAVREPVVYNNTDYGFNFSLPDNWQGYLIMNDTWSGTVLASSTTQSGPKLLIRNPKWTAADPYENLPILVFTIAQWESYQKEDFSIGAAPIPASELARNNKYVFALPARWDFDYSLDFKEAQEIIASNALRAYNIGILDTDPALVLACDQAVTTMKFADAKSLSTYLTDCKNGKHPEVIEKYNANMNVDSEPATPTETITITIYQLFAKLFIVYPIFALLPAFILGLFYFQSRNKLIFITLLLWILYMVYEELHLLRILCTGECNIRIDLLVIYPVLIILTLVALFQGIKNLVKSFTS